MADLGTAVIHLNFDSSALTKGIVDAQKQINELGNAGDNASSKLKDFGKAVLTEVAAVTLAAKQAASAVTSFAKSAVSSYADYEQLTGGVETLFKESSDLLMDYASQAYKTAGMSANEYMEQSTSFAASLIQSLGGDTAKAAEYANTAITDMADNANKMGTDMERITDAYQGFAKQNYTMLDNLKLGYGGTKTEMERLLTDAEKIKAANGEMVDYSIDKYSDIVEAIHVVQENMGITGTTAEEAEHTITGSLNTLKASWENLKTGIADPDADFNTLFENFKTSLFNFIDNAGPAVETALEGIAELIYKLSPMISEKLPELVEKLLPPILTAMGSIANAIISNLPTIIGTIATTLQNNPEIASALGKGITTLIGVAVGKVVVTKAFSALSGKISSGLKNVFSKTSSKSASKTLSTNIQDSVSNATETASKSSKITNGFSKIGEKIKTGASSLKSGIVGALSGLKEILTSVVEVVTEPLKTLVKGIAEAIASFFTALANPQIAVGAAMFAVAAASIAAAIVLIGSAIGLVTPSLAAFMTTVLIPFATFLATTLLTALTVITDLIIRLTNEALIPVGTFLRDTILIIITTISDTIINLTNNAIIPLVNTLSGSFVTILYAVGDVLTQVGGIINGIFRTALDGIRGIIRDVGDTINNVLKTALEGIQGVIREVGNAFEKMGSAIKQALDGVSGVLGQFKEIIVAIGNAIIATVALVTGRSVSYGNGYARVYAKGGKVVGPGTSTSDSIPAMLSNGEYVIRAAAAESIGYDNLDALNETGAFSTVGRVYQNIATDEVEPTSNNVVVNMEVQVNNEMDAADIGRKIEESIRRYV